MTIEQQAKEYIRHNRPDESYHTHDFASALLERAGQRDDALRALSSVLSTLDRAAGSPAEQAIYNRARALLREHGIGEAHNAERQKAIDEWLARRPGPGRGEP